MQPAPLLTVKDACRHLAISRATLYRLMSEGRIRPVKIGASVRFKADDLTRFIEASQATPDPDAAGPRAGLGWATVAR